MEALTGDDAVVATYREHGHALARGVPAAAVMAEMYGKVEGTQPRAGRLDAHVRSLPGASTAATPSSGADCRSPSDSPWPTECSSRRAVTACFFGEGAVAEGEFHEAMNLAALWRLPVLFCCENNLYAMGTALSRSESETNLAYKAAALRDAGVDGRWHGRARGRRRRASGPSTEIRGGGGPVFLELRTFRFRAHSMYDPERYRSKAEVEAWRDRDPIAVLHRPAVRRGAAGRR